MKVNINEIFKSVQGEGKYIGLPMVFVRFAGCDFGCSWCDTDHHSVEELSPDELMARVQKLYTPGCFVSLTGGEPLMQWQFLEKALPMLKKYNMPIFLETNGVLYQEFLKIKDSIDVVSMDFKLPSSAGCPAFWTEHQKMMEAAADKDFYIKIVITRNTDIKDLESAIGVISSVNDCATVYLQPDTNGLKEGSLERCLAFQEAAMKALKDVRVVPQVHRLIGIK